VHRLVQNKADGKLVQVDEGGNIVHEEKVDSLALEYTYLLTSQLEQQRHHFEERLQQIEKHKDRQIEELEQQVKVVLIDSAKKDQTVATLSKEKHALEKKCTLLQTKLTKLTTDVNNEQEMNEGLRKNQVDWQNKVALLDERLNKKDAEMAELQDQLRDVMFFLEAKQTLSSNQDVTQAEIQEGQILVQASPEGAAGGTSGGRKSKRKPR
jgi:BRCA1-associated protein